MPSLPEWREAMSEYVAYLRVKRFSNNETVRSVGLKNLSERWVEKVMMGMLRNMNSEDFYIDDSEVDAARVLEEKP